VGRIVTHRMQVAGIYREERYMNRLGRRVSSRSPAAPVGLGSRPGYGPKVRPEAAMKSVFYILARAGVHRLPATVLSISTHPRCRLASFVPMSVIATLPAAILWQKAQPNSAKRLVFFCCWGVRWSTGTEAM